MENEVEIYYKDLTEEKKKEIRKLLGVSTDKEVYEVTNGDIIPIATATII